SATISSIRASFSSELPTVPELTEVAGDTVVVVGTTVVGGVAERVVVVGVDLVVVAGGAMVVEAGEALEHDATSSAMAAAAALPCFFTSRPYSTGTTWLLPAPNQQNYRSILLYNAIGCQREIRSTTHRDYSTS
ncbi:MAG: hypothetical protein OEM40_02165, partial [Acidimicrobiia bacterium]|nr:hypothetical protein [Acidimicrobiia bacterium]